MNTLSTHEVLVHSLLKPAAYPHAVDSVTCIETHISAVFLAGSFAYKIKKPVNFGFVDFSTLQKRKKYCEEESRLNRRLAPHIYLEVVPIFGPIEEPSFSGDGEPIEYAVKMRRFPQDQLLSELAENNHLDPALIIDLAERVADFHINAAERAPEASPLGCADSMHHWFNENFEQIERLVKDAPTLESLSALKVWGERQYKQNQDLLTIRKQAGFVRECHGDLHLGNIVAIDKVPVCFDCIEFNDDFRWIDTMNEVAFLLMDLDHRGYLQLACEFINRYLKITGDYDGLTLLNYYRVYRALVRAKVSLLKQSPPYDFSEFDHYLQLSLNYIKPAKPTLIITHGVSGSGKSYWSELISQEIGAIHIRSDIERKRLFGFSANQQTNASTMQGIYTRDITQKTYENLRNISALILNAGFSVIVDATFLLISDRSAFKSLAEQLDLQFFILAFSADDAMLRQRIQQRIIKNNDPSEANEEILNDQVKKIEKLSEEESANALIINNKKEVNLKKLINEIICTSSDLI